MKTTKAYLAGLGMTGIVIGSILVLLAVGTGVVAFDAAPDLSTPRQPLDRVVADRDAVAGSARGKAHRERGRRDLPIAAADRPRLGSPGRVQERSGEARPRAPARGRGTQGGTARGFGGAESWVRERLGGGAALGAGEVGAGGRPEVSRSADGGERRAEPGAPGGGTILPSPIDELGGGVSEALVDPLR